MITHKDFNDITGGESYVIAGSISYGFDAVEHTIKYKEFRQVALLTRQDHIDQWVSDNIKRFLKEVLNK